MKFKIALPLLVALIIVLGTVGIVSASYVIHRNINVSVLDPIIITPDADVPITVYRGASTQVPFQVHNDTSASTNVSVTYDSVPPGMAVTITPVSFTCAPQETVVVTATIFADSSSVNSTITLHFTTS